MTRRFCLLVGQPVCDSCVWAYPERYYKINATAAKLFYGMTTRVLKRLSSVRVLHPLKLGTKSKRERVFLMCDVEEACALRYGSVDEFLQRSSSALNKTCAWFEPGDGIDNEKKAKIEKYDWRPSVSLVLVDKPLDEKRWGILDVPVCVSGADGKPVVQQRYTGTDSMTHVIIGGSTQQRSSVRKRLREGKLLRGQRQCPKCGQVKTKDDYSTRAWTRPILSLPCLQCTTRVCSDCGEERHRDEFEDSEWRKNVAYAKCRGCTGWTCIKCDARVAKKGFGHKAWATRTTIPPACSACKPSKKRARQLKAQQQESKRRRNLEF